MRYGKIYYYDRLGNKVHDEEPIIKDEIHHFSIDSARIKVHANVPFNENLVIPDIKSLNDLNSGLMSDRLTTQDMITFDQPSMPDDLDEINFGQVNGSLAMDRGYSIQGDRKLRQRSAYNPVFTPLNDLKDPDDPKVELAQEMDKMNLGNQPPLGPYDSILDDDLCDECKARCRTTTEDQCGLKSEGDLEDSARLRFKLREHIDEVNRDLMQRNKRRELLPMNVLPPFANRLDERDEKIQAQKERQRQEFSDSLSRKPQPDLGDIDRPSIKTGQAYANEQEEQKAIEIMNARKDAEFNHMQAEMQRRRAKEENKVEWWETRDALSEYRQDHDRKHYADQMRRNEALRHNVEQLEQFEDKFRQERQASHLMRHKKFDRDPQEKTRDVTELTRSEAAERQRNLLESVWQSWADAHRTNDRRYQVLQEYDARRHRPIQPSMSAVAATSSSDPHMECNVRRCRRCQRPLTRRVAFVK